MATLDTLILRLATPPALAALFVAFIALTLLFLAARPVDRAGNEVPALDGEPFYRPGQVYEDYVERYSPSSLKMYAARELTLDMAYPLVYGLLGAALLTLLLGGFEESRPWLYALRWLPVAMALCDIVENVGIATMLLLYSKGKVVPALPWIIRIASAGKFFFALSSGLFVLFVIAGAVQKLAQAWF